MKHTCTIRLGSQGQSCKELTSEAKAKTDRHGPNTHVLPTMDTLTSSPGLYSWHHGPGLCLRRSAGLIHLPNCSPPKFLTVFQHTCAVKVLDFVFARSDLRRCTEVLKMLLRPRLDSGGDYNAPRVDTLPISHLLDPLGVSFSALLAPCFN